MGKTYSWQDNRFPVHPSVAARNPQPERAALWVRQISGEILLYLCCVIIRTYVYFVFRIFNKVVILLYSFNPVRNSLP